MGTRNAASRRHYQEQATPIIGGGPRFLRFLFIRPAKATIDSAPYCKELTEPRMARRAHLLRPRESLVSLEFRHRRNHLWIASSELTLALGP
jgi:hypothetical protein